MANILGIKGIWLLPFEHMFAGTILSPTPTNAIISLCKPSKKLGLDQANLLPVNRATPEAAQRTNIAWLS